MGSPRKLAILASFILFATVLLLTGCKKNNAATQATATSEATASSQSASQSTKDATQNNFTTYTDEQKLFSISYPSDWITAQSAVPAIEEKAKEAVRKLQTGVPLDQFTLLFAAGKPSGQGLDPNLQIGIESIKVSASIEQVVEASIRTIKETVTDYVQYAQTKINIGEQEAILLELGGTFPGYMRIHQLQLYVVVGQLVWLIGCATTPEYYQEAKETCDMIARSFRILKG